MHRSDYRFPMKPVRAYPGPHVDRVLADPAWNIELKYDGHRGMVYVNGDGTVEVWNRHEGFIPGLRIPDIYAVLRSLHLDAGTVLDGEIYPRGVNSGRMVPALPGTYKLALFDVMHLARPLAERQARLVEMIAGGPEG